MELAPRDVGTIGFGGFMALASTVGAFPIHIGGTIDWAGVAANNGTNAVVTIAVSGGAGTFTVSVTRGGSTQTTAGQAYNVALATLRTALEGLSNVGAGNVLVTGTPGTSYVLEFIEDTGKQPVGVTSLGAGGATATATNTTVGAIPAVQTLPGGFTVNIGDKVIPAGTVLYKTASNPPKFAVATNATTLVVGQTYVANQHILYSLQSNQVGTLYDNGTFLKDCLKVGGTGQPTLANLLAACPGIRIKETN